MNKLKLFDDLYVKKAFETEKQFYLAKYKHKLNKENEKDGKNESKRKSSLINKLFKESQRNIDKIKMNNENNKTSNNGNIYEQINFEIVNKVKNRRRNTLMLETKKNNKIERSDKYKNSLTKSEKGKLSNMNLTNLSRVYNQPMKYSKKNSKISSCKLNVDISIRECHKIYNRNRMKKIKARSRDYANSLAELNYMQYEPMNQTYMKVNDNNLRRVIKIGEIKKYKHNLQDDDLLLYNPKLLKDKIYKTQLNYYQSYFNKECHFNFIKKKFRPQTIRKFSYIKDSFFGIPC
jgi:hypothetical protein